MADFEIVRGTPAQRTIFENLMHLYLYDFTEYDDLDVDEQGRFVDEHLDRYWAEPGRHAFLIRVGGKWAGFVLVREVAHEKEGTPAHSIAEFFVLKKYRRKKIGQGAAWLIFDRFPGLWRVAQEEANLPAQRFWRSVIGAYTAGKFTEVSDPGWRGPVQEFNTADRALP